MGVSENVVARAEVGRAWGVGDLGDRASHGVHLRPFSVGHVGKASLKRAIVFSMLLASDAVALYLAVAVAGLAAWWLNVHVFQVQYQAFGSATLVNRLGLWSALIAALCAWFAMTGTYTARHTFQEDLKRTLSALFVMLMIDGFVEFASREQFSRLWILLVWPVAAMLIPLMRVVVRRGLSAAGLWRVGAAVIGDGAHYASVAQTLERDTYVGYYVAFYSELARDLEQSLPDYAAQLAKDVKLRGAEMVILVPSAHEMPKLDRIVDALNLNLVPYILVPPVQRLPLAGMTVQAILNSDAIMMTARNGLMSPVRQIAKRVFDVAVAGSLLLLFSPMFAILAALVATSGRPIFYGHQRIGRGAKPFGCLKFRTMVPNSEAVLAELLANNPAVADEWRRNFKLVDDPRITRIGKFLRKSSLDELPQLFNVLRGEMSLVGPRPVVADELRRYYGEDAFYYQLVRPGITGLWQVNGRSATSYERRVFLDTWYVRNWSLWTDLVILFGTVPSVIAGSGAR